MMESLRKALRAVLRRGHDWVYGDKPARHRVPFGPIAGSFLFAKPSMSLRMWWGCDEPRMLRVAGRLLRAGDIVYDIGAHIGYTALFFARRTGRTGGVHAFELVPSTSRLLQKAAALNRAHSCRAHTIGLGNSNTRFEIAVSDAGMGNIPYGSKRRPNDNARREECRTVRLDDYAAAVGISSPQFIKMDVQGFEVAALEGAVRTIQTAEPLMIIEFHGVELLKQGLALLENLGYAALLLTGEEADEDYLSKLLSFNESVLFFKPRCGWHLDRMARLRRGRDW